jgi:hypothetical protein
MASILTPEDVVRRIAAECAFIDERGAVGIRLKPARRNRAPVRRAIPAAAPAKAKPPAKAAAVVVISQRAASKKAMWSCPMALCSLAPTLGAGSHRAPGIRRRGSMFHPVDTGPFKLVVLRPTNSIKAHPQSRYSKPGRAYPTASNTQFSAAHRPVSTQLGHSAFAPGTALPAPETDMAIWHRGAIGGELAETAPPGSRKGLGEELASRRVRSRCRCGTARRRRVIVRPHPEDRPQ